MRASNPFGQFATTGRVVPDTTLTPFTFALHTTVNTRPPRELCDACPHCQTRARQVCTTPLTRLNAWSCHALASNTAGAPYRPHRHGLRDYC